jgi:hypothetical protein
MSINHSDNPQRTRFLVVAGIFAVLVILVVVLAVGGDDEGLPSDASGRATAIVGTNYAIETQVSAEQSAELNPIFRTATANAQSLPSGGVTGCCGGGGIPAPTQQAIPETGGGGDSGGGLPDAGGGDSGGGFVNVDRPLQERIVIKNADMSIVVDDAEETAAQITDLVEGMGGWVVSSNIITSVKSATSDEDPTTRGSIQVRVPAEQLEQVVAQVRAMALLVRSESIFGDDVTNQYVDLQSQLRNLQSAEEQLVEIMDSADSTEGVVEVFNQLTRIRGDIERITGQLQFFDESAAFSSLRVELSPPEPERTPTPTPTHTPEPAWRPGQTFDDAVDGAVETAQDGVDAVIYILVFGVLAVVVIGIPAVVAFTVWRRNRSI